MANSDPLPPSAPVPKGATANTTSSPLDNINLNKVSLPKEITRNWRKEGKLFDALNIFTEATFSYELNKYTTLDVLTYTISPLPLPISRLLYAVGTPSFRVKQSRRISGSHAKIWICYKDVDQKTFDVFLGSANATSMTLHELMVKLLPAQACAVLTHFNRLWEQ